MNSAPSDHACVIMDQAVMDAEEAAEYYDCLAELTKTRHPQYKLLLSLGKGPCGRVFKARNTYSNDIVAVKVIETNDREWVTREGDALFEIKKEVRRFNSSSTYGSFGLQEIKDVVPFLDTLWMVSPWCSGGSLKTLMLPRGHLMEKYIAYVLRDVARALFWIHAQGSFHGNVKAANILVDEKGSVQLCDFDLVTRGELSPSHSESALLGSMHWLAPECLRERHDFDTGMDVWSFGALAYELATGLPPNASLGSDTAILDHMERFGPPTLTGDKHSDGLKDLISHCLIIDIKRRPSMNLVFAHPYLSSTPNFTSLIGLVDEYQQWEDKQLAEESMDAEEFMYTSEHAKPNSQEAPLLPTNEVGSGLSPEQLPSDSEGGLSTWSVIDEPSRCSSPFDLEHLVLRTSDVSRDGASPTTPHINQMQRQQPFTDSNGETSHEDGDETRGVPITIGMSLSQARESFDPMPTTDNCGLTMDFNMVFNPDFDIFALDPASTSSSAMLNATPRQITQPLTEHFEDSWPASGKALHPTPYLWDSPPLSPSSSPSKGTGWRPLASIWPTTTDSQQSKPNETVIETIGVRDGPEDDDDSSTLRPRDSNPVNLERAVAGAAPSTPPTTPDQSCSSKSKEPVSSPHAWPPYRLTSRSTNEATPAPTSPPPTPAVLKPLPPLPKPTFPSSQQRPSTAGGTSSSRSAFQTAAPPVPSIPAATRRPSLDIFNPVSYDSFGSSFDTNGNYIPHPAPLSPTQPFLVLASTPQDIHAAPVDVPRTRRSKGKASAMRMIPREAGSCPPRRRKSNPTPCTSRATTSTSSHAPKSSSSSSSSSSSLKRQPGTKPPPRNASFSVFPTSQSSSLAAAAQAAMNARNLISSSSNNSTVLPPRRPSAPLPNTQQSFFDYDADEDSDLEEYDVARGGGAGDFKKGMKRIVNSVSTNLGGTIRGLETAPLKGFRWIKRGSP